MKVLKVLLIIVTLLIGLVAGAYFVLTRPGIQKNFIAKQLPAGSSIEFIQMTAGGLELENLQVSLDDGSRLKIGRVETHFSLWDAMFNQTINLGVLEVDAFDLNIVSPASETSAGALEDHAEDGEASEDAMDPLDALYAIGESDWLFKVERIQVNGQIQAYDGDELIFKLESGEIAPGLASELNFEMSLKSNELAEGSLQSIRSQVTLGFTQKATGGFEKIALQSAINGADAAGGNLLEFTQNAVLTIQSETKTGSVESEFQVSMPNPAELSSSLQPFERIELEGALALVTEGDTATLQTLHFDSIVNDRKAIQVALKQTLKLGEGASYIGDILDIEITQLPMAWLAPFLPDGYVLSGSDFSTSIRLAGLEAAGQGARFVSNGPVKVGPITMEDSNGLLLEAVQFSFQPMIEFRPEEGVVFDLGLVEIRSGVNTILTGEIKGAQKDEDLKVDSHFKLKLPALFQQAVFARSGKVNSGELDIIATVDTEQTMPYRVEVVATQLLSSAPVRRLPEYRFSLQAQRSSEDRYSVIADVSVGREAAPSSALNFSATASPMATPITFEFELTGDQIIQSDFTALSGVFHPVESQSVSGPAQPDVSDEPSTLPEWKGYVGKGDVAIKRIQLDGGIELSDFEAELQVSEPLLSLKELSVNLGGGSAKGHAEVRYAADDVAAHQIDTEFDLKSVNPGLLVEQTRKALPIAGQFDGELKATGSGADLNAAIDDLEGGLSITGTDGVFTAFGMNEKAQLGLGLVGILGQSLERPGIAALAQAVPYFKDIRFDTFNLELERSAGKQIKVSDLQLVGQNLYFEGIGFVAATKLSDLMNQPLDLQLSLGAKGGLVSALETLNLLKASSNTEGFREWTQSISIGGTLANPDTDALRALLNDAAKKALEKRPTTSSTTTQSGDTSAADASTEAKPKAQKRRDELDIGLELLNNVLGQ